MSRYDKPSLPSALTDRMKIRRAAVANAPAPVGADWSSLTGELAAALGNDQNFAATMTAALAGKAPVSHTHPADRTGQSLFKPASGVFISNWTNASALGTAAQTANRHILSPFIPAYDLTIDMVGVSVSTLLAGANCKVTIFDTDADGRPSTLLRESGNLSAAATGTVTGSIATLALTAGKLYWIGVRSSGSQTLRTLAVGATAVLSLTTAATPVSQGTLTLTETFANAAANWDYASSQHSNTVMPLVLLRVA